MFFTLLVVFFTSLMTSILFVGFLGKKFRCLLDQDMHGIQKFHNKPVPRTGGIAIFLGLFSSLLVAHPITHMPIFLLLMASLPAFLGGITEDITKKVPPLARLLLTFCSAAIGFYLFDAQANRLGADFIDDHMLIFTPVALIITIFMVGGVSHSVNIIDGYHGLMPGLMLIIFSAMAYISYQLHDALMLDVNVLIASAIAGFLLLNFPFGKIFSGDGGAYFLGYLAATVSLLMVKRNAHLSPWFALLLMIFPVWETIFSVYRRKFIQKVSATEPDDLHLHSLIYQWLVQSKSQSQPVQLPVVASQTAPLQAAQSKPLIPSASANAMVAPYLWLFCISLNILPAIWFWHDSKLLIGFTILFIGIYLILYNLLMKQTKVRTRV